MQILVHKNERADLITVTLPDGGTATGYLPKELMAGDSPVRSQAAALAAALPAYANAVTGIAAHYGSDGTGRRPELAAATVNAIAGPLQKFADAGRAEKGAFAAASARIASYRTGAPANRPLIVDKFDKLDVADQAAWASSMTVEETRVRTQLSQYATRAAR